MQLMGVSEANAVSILGTYNRYLQVIADANENGASVVPDGFAGFYGASGDGARGPQVWESAVSRGLLGGSGTAWEVLRDASAAASGTSGTAGGVVEVECADLGGEVEGAVGGAVDPLEGLSGRQRRKKKRAMKAVGRKASVFGTKAEPVEEALPEVVAEKKEPLAGKSDAVCVPEWRRKKPVVSAHRGYFSECSLDTQKELKETRAQMMIARNRAAVAKAKEEAVRSEAAVKSRQVEQLAELKRLQTEAKLRKALESKFGVGMQSGFAETVVSNGLEEVCGTPSLSDGSVSPNSSISVCAVRKMEQTIKDLAEKVRDLQREKDALLAKKGKDNGKEKSDEDYDGPISEAEYRRNCDIMYGMRPGATKPMDAKYDELMVKMCAEGFSALGTEDLNELQAYGEFYG